MKKPPQIIDAKNIEEVLQNFPDLFDPICKSTKPKSRQKVLAQWQGAVLKVDIGYWEVRRSGNSGEVYLFLPNEAAIYDPAVQKYLDQIHYGEPYFVNPEDSMEYWRMYGGFGKRKFFSDKSKKKKGLRRPYEVLKKGLP